MVQRIVAPDPRELRDIHLAVCRARKQALCCSTCAELTERAARVILRAQLVEAA